MKTIAEYIEAECDSICSLLLEKNLAYGNSVGNPINIFSQLPGIEQINVRIDDKLSRLKRGSTYGVEDTTLDLIGYLILKRAIINYNTEEKS